MLGGGVEGFARPQGLGERRASSSSDADSESTTESSFPATVCMFMFGRADKSSVCNSMSSPRSVGGGPVTMTDSHFVSPVCALYRKTAPDSSSLYFWKGMGEGGLWRTEDRGNDNYANESRTARGQVADQEQLGRRWGV